MMESITSLAPFGKNRSFIGFGNLSLFAGKKLMFVAL
jgi:hypothetical protein